MVSLKRLFVVSALFSAFLFALNTFAFIGPTVSPGTGGGSLQLDASGNIGVGTSSSTPVSTFNATSTESGSTAHGRVFMVASSTNPGVGLKNLTSGNTYLWSARNFGNLQLYRESASFPGLVVIDINQFGDVSIGTSTPSAGNGSRLTIGGGISASAVNATLTGNVPASGVTTGVFSSGNFAFQNALGVGTTSLVGLPTNGLLVTGTTTLATTAGNVGIGTTAPDQKLQVAGNIRLPVTGGKIAFGTAGTSPSDYLMLQDIASPSPALEFVQDGVARFIVQGQTGNVGIGTSTPAAKLHVYAGDVFVSKATTPTITLNNISGGMAGEFAIRVNGENFEIIEPEDSSRLAYRISEAGASSDRFVNQFFYDGTNVSLSTDLNGNVGVRTSNPSSSLHVVGSTTITDDLYLTNNKSIRLDSGSNTTLLVANYNSGIFAYGTGETASLAVEGDVKGNRLCFGDADCQTSWSGIVASGGGNYWVNSGSNLYPSSTSWNVGVGTTTPTSKLYVLGGDFTISPLGTGSYGALKIESPNSISVNLQALRQDTGAFTRDLSLNARGGNVGIGTTTPTAKLDVNGGWINYNGDGTGIQLSSAAGVWRSYMASDANRDWYLYTNGEGDVLSIRNGFIGIGTTTPSTTLHVVTGGGNAATFSSAITIGYPVLSTDAARKDYVDNNFALSSGVSGVWKLSGNNLYASSTSYIVGVGTTTPTMNLQVSSATVGSGSRSGVSNLDSTNFLYMWPGFSGASNDAAIVWDSVGDLRFGTESVVGTGFSEKMRIETGGNVGIGTTTPARPLHLDVGSATNNGFRIGRGAATNNPYADFLVNTVSTPYLSIQPGDNSTYRNTVINAAGGNVGIGTTTPTYKLQVDSGATDDTLKLVSTRNIATQAPVLIYAQKGTNSTDNDRALIIFNHDRRDNSGVMSAGIGSRVFSSSSATGLGLDFATGGTTSRMVINQTGLVGIGTTVPSTTLHVVSGGGNAATFSSAITIGYPSLPTDAARKDYVDAAVGVAQSASWIQSGSNLYPSSTNWNVGIGTTNPEGTLDVRGMRSIIGGYLQIRDFDDNSTSTSIISRDTTTMFWSGGVVVGSYASGSVPLGFSTTGTLLSTGQTALAVSSGNVGIGTTTPVSKFQLSKIGANTISLANSHFYFSDDTLDVGLMGQQRLGSPFGFSLQVSNRAANAFYPLALNPLGGNVGIGTTTPATTLHVVAASGNAATFSSAITVGYPALSTDAMRKDYADAYYAPITGASGIWKLSGNNLYASSTSYSVGIGTATPSEQLHVSPNGQASSTRRAVRIGSSYNLNIQNYINPNADSAIFQNAYIDGGTDGQASYKWTTSHATYGSRGINMSFVDGITFYADNARSTTTQAFTPTERMRITNAGNVGIGTTSPSGALDVVGTSILGSIRFVNAGGINYIQSGSTTRATDSWLPLYFGNYGTTATIKMVIDNSGNVGVGTTTPGAKLHLQGTEGAATNSGTPNGISWIGSPTTNIILAAGVNGTGGTHSWLQSQNRTSATFYPLALNPLGGNVGIGTTTPSTTLHVVAPSGNAATFSSAITIGYPAIATDAARKDYVDNNYAPISGASGVWKLSGNNLYASSTSYSVGIGLTNPAAPLNVYATSSLATSTETIRLSAPQNYTAGFGPKLSFWNGTSEQLALISGVVQTTSNGNFGSLHFGTRTTDALGVQTKMSILANGSVGVGTTTPANRLSVVGGNISIQPSQVIGSGLTFDSPTSAASSSIELYNSSTGDLTIRTGYTNGDILLMPRQYVGIGTTTPTSTLHVVSLGAPAAIFSHPITVGYPLAATDATTKSYVDTAIGSGSPTAYATSSFACNADATCEMQNANLGGTGNIVGVNKLTVTTIDPLYEIKGKKYSTYASAIVGGVKEEYVGRGEMKRVANGSWQMVVDFENINDGSDLWVWRHAIDFSSNNVEVLATPMGVPVPIAYEVDDNKIIFSASSEGINRKLSTINFSYRLIGKRLDWAEWPTYAKDQSEKPGLIYENYIKGYLVK